MSELSTVLISDSRYNDITSSVTISVKDGPASVIHQKYQHNSNSTSSTLFNVNVPSENTLIDRNIHVQGTISCYYEVAIAAGETLTFKVVPSSFPMNHALQSASITLNNSKLSVQTQDILPIYLKQFDQKFLSKNCQMTPSFVDKYYGKVPDAVTNDGSGSYMSGIESAEKDSDTVGRFNENFTVTVYLGDIIAANIQAADPDTGLYTVVGVAASTVTVLCSVTISEALLGLPTCVMKEDESNYLSINALELLLQWNDMRNVFYISGDYLWKSYAGTITDRLVLDESAKLNLKYMSLHASQYSKLQSKNVLPYDEMVCYKRLFTGSNATTQQVTDVISMRQIPNYIYMVIRPQYNSMKPQFSNHLCFPITGLNITFNNVSGLLTSYSQNDLYQMSRRNGSNQTWSEFRGLVKSKSGTEYTGIGSIIVIDCVRDLNLSDFLSSGSLGQFSFQATVTFENILGHTYGEPTSNATASNFQAMEIATICNYGGILINDKGSSSTMSGLLSKTSVLEAKSGNNPSINYEELQEMSGGNFNKKGTTNMSTILEKVKHMGKGKYKELMKANPTVGQIQDKLSKYM
jgi:hypothetical protein